MPCHICQQSTPLVAAAATAAQQSLGTGHHVTPILCQLAALWRTWRHKAAQGGAVSSAIVQCHVHPLRLLLQLRQLAQQAHLQRGLGRLSGAERATLWLRRHMQAPSLHEAPAVRALLLATNAVPW